METIPTPLAPVRPAMLGFMLAAIAAAGAQPPNASQLPQAAPARPNARWPMGGRTMPKADWVDPDHGAPDGTQYKTFLSDVLTELGIQHGYEDVPGLAHESLIYYRKLGTTVFNFHRKSLGAPDLSH